jgi:membrane-associated protease RseP (regulator of RpoE activity)
LIGYLVAGAAVGAYLVIVLIGHRRGTWKRLNISVYGPVLMLRTKRGKGVIGSLARPKSFWRLYGRASIAVSLLAMAVMTLFLAYQVAEPGAGLSSRSTSVDRSVELPQADIFTTAGYVIAGFVVAVLIHELAHGVQAIAGKMKLSSIGVLVAVVPIGAFVEPDERDLKASSRRVRSSVYAAGPATNLLFALMCTVILLGVIGPSASPVAKGAVVTDVASDSPAVFYGLNVWSEIVSVEGAPVLNSTQMSEVSFARPGELVRVDMIYESHELTLEVPGGVVVHEVFEGPGWDAGMRTGMIIDSLNDTPINSVSEFRSVTENASRNSPVNISVLKYATNPRTGESGFFEDLSIRTVNLTSKWLYYYTHYPSWNREQFKTVSFMAVSVSPFGIRTEDPEYLTDRVAKPFKSVDGAKDFAGRLQDFISIPFVGYSPVVPPASDLYEPSGALSFMPGSVYWVLLNLLYWLFWANLVLGLSNLLPAFPFDGGYLLRDAIAGIASWWGLRLTGLDTTIGRRTLSDKEVDSLTWFVSGLVILALVYIFLSGVWGPF